MMNHHSTVHLPVQITPFVGREVEIAALCDLLGQEETRLVTIVGAGGMGKTRLAIEVAAHQGENFPDGVYFVPLASKSSPRQIVHGILDTLDLSLSPGGDPQTELLRYLGDKQLLLLVDNFEHLVTGAPLLNEILEAAPDVKLLTTSRENMKLTSEMVYRLAGLTYGDWRTPEEALSSGAGRLFIQSAQRTRPGFEITQENLPSVANTCKLVEGMPLGILLATAWVDVLSTAEIAAEIQDNMDFLETEMQDVPERQRSIRAVFETSWERLTQAERELYKQLSVFRGGFTYHAAKEVASASARDLAGLVNKSFLHRDPDSGRYSVHELLRGYAEERLKETPEREGAVRDRHCAYFSKFMDQPYKNFFGPKMKETVKAIEADIDNVWSAWDWAVKQTRIGDLHRSMEGMSFFEWSTSWLHEGEQAFRTAVAALRTVETSPERDIALGYGLALQSSITSLTGHRQRAIELIDESLALLRPHGVRYELAHSLVLKGSILMMMGKSKNAKELSLEAANLFEEIGHKEQQADAYRSAGENAQRQGQFAESNKWYQKALSLAREVDNFGAIAYTLKDLGDLNLELGKYVEAEQYAQNGLAIARSHEFKVVIVNALRVLGQVAEATGDLEKAEGFLRESLAGAREWGKRQITNLILILLAHVLAAQGKYDAAKNLLQEAQERVIKDYWPKRYLLAGMGNLAYRSGDFSEAQRFHEECLALCREQGDRINIGGNQNALGRIALALGDGAEARDHFLTALQEGIELDAPPLMLDSISGFAEWLSQAGDPGQAVQLATLVNNHPASHAETKERTTNLLRQLLEADLPPEDFAARVEQSPQDDLANVAKTLAAQLASADKPATTPTPQPLVEPLSERELEVLRLVANGKSNREIARELVLALGTVKSHLHNILQKLDARSRTQAVARAREYGLL